MELASPGEPVTPEVLLGRFDPGRLPREPWVVIPTLRSKVRLVIIWADGTVTDIRAEWKGAVELTVARRDAGAEEVRALAYTDLMAAPAVGDRVLLNVAALDRGPAPASTPWLSPCWMPRGA